MKAAKILFISALFTIVLFENCNIFIAKTAVPQAEVNPAYYYGQQIYTKENCSSCHNFNILEKTDGKVSLDGIGNKYSDAWLYYYFFEPSSVYPASEKKAYDHLYQNEVDYDLLSKLIKKNYKKQDPDKLKADFNQELNEIKVELAKQGIEANYSEILPLIYFIQGIPESDAKHRMDSTKELEKTERLNAVLNEVITASNDSGSVVKGKQLFKKYCAVCHGDSGQGYIGPNTQMSIGFMEELKPI